MMDSGLDQHTKVLRNRTRVFRYCLTFTRMCVDVGQPDSPRDIDGWTVGQATTHHRSPLVTTPLLFTHR